MTRFPKGCSSKQAPSVATSMSVATQQPDRVVVGDGDELLVVFIRVFNNFREEEVAEVLREDFGLGLEDRQEVVGVLDAGASHRQRRGEFRPGTVR